MFTRKHEWDSEPDRKHWIDGETGLDCLIVRNTLYGKGALCGYVGVPEGHPWYGEHYNNCDADVHGGLTFAAACDLEGKICHSVEKDGAIACDKVWWLGFDCAHLGDYIPGSRLPGFGDREVYRNIAYVENECRSLAKQVKEKENATEEINR